MAAVRPGVGDTIEVETAGPARWAVLRGLRLRALRTAPDAFGAQYEDERDRPRDDWQARLARTDRAVLLAWHGTPPPVDVTDRVPAGMAVLARPPHTPERARVDGDLGIYSLFVDTWARGRGVGEALLQAALDEARRTGERRLVLDVGDYNTAAQALYHRFGFEPTGRTGSLPPPRTHVTEHELALPVS